MTTQLSHAAMLARCDKLMARSPMTGSDMYDYQMESMRLDMEVKAAGFKSWAELREAVDAVLPVIRDV